MNCVCVDVNCGNPTSTLPENSEVRGGAPVSVSSGTILKVDCKETRRFDDFSSVQTITCQPDGTWTAIVPKCSMLIFVFSLIKLVI